MDPPILVGNLALCFNVSKYQLKKKAIQEGELIGELGVVLLFTFPVRKNM